MNFKTLILSLTLLSTSAFAQQKIHPDLDVPTVDFRKFEQQQRSIKETLDDIEFYSEGEIDALSVSIPDYKTAATNFNNYASAVLSDYNNGLEDIKTEALLGSKDISELQAEYSAKLFALEAAMKKYPQSKDTFKKTYSLESKRMKIELEGMYKNLIISLQGKYSSLLELTFTNSKLIAANVRKPGVDDRIANIVSMPFITIATIILWAAPAPFPVLLSPNMWCNDSYKTNCRGFWAIMKSAKDAVAVKPKKEAYKYAMETVSDALFTDCKTAACAYELGKGYKNFFLKVIKLNKDLKIGDEKLESNIDIKKRKIKKLLKDAINYAAAKRPTAVYTRHGQN